MLYNTYRSAAIKPLFCEFLGRVGRNGFITKIHVLEMKKINIINNKNEQPGLTKE